MNGMAIGPMSPATHLMTTEMMSLNVGELIWVASAIESPRKASVDSRAASRPLRSLQVRADFERTGAMSRVKTAEMALASEEHMAIVCEKKPTTTRPSSP